MDTRWSRRLLGFNTTIVSVEPLVGNACEGAEKVSIQPLFRWNPILMLKKNKLKVVSIQPLFRWNVRIRGTRKTLDFMFQYNHCFGGTSIPSISSSKSTVSIQPLFRWNFKKRFRKKQKLVVSIQPLFRWNYYKNLIIHLQISFNTTIVSVERLLLLL